MKIQFALGCCLSLLSLSSAASWEVIERKSSGSGDVPQRLGTHGLRIFYGDEPGDPLFTDLFLPVTGPDNTRRIADWDPVLQMEGMRLLHPKAQLESNDYPGWVEWFQKFGHRESGLDLGVHYKHIRDALEAVRQIVGFLVCGLSLVLGDLEDRSIVAPFPLSHYITAPHSYRLRLRIDAEKRPQIQRFITWLHNTANETQREIERLSNQTTC